MKTFSNLVEDGGQAKNVAKQQTNDGFIENIKSLNLTEYEKERIKHIQREHPSLTYGDLDLQILVDGKGFTDDEPMHWHTINERLARMIIEKYNK